MPFSYDSNMVLVSLLTAVVLDAFAESKDAAATQAGVYRLSREAGETYSELWAAAAYPSRSLVLHEYECVPIIAQLPAPLGVAFEGERGSGKKVLGGRSPIVAPDNADTPRTPLGTPGSGRRRDSACLYVPARDGRGRAVPLPLQSAIVASEMAERYPTATAAGVSAAALRRAELLLRRLPLATDAAGCIHFHALLQALVDFASLVPPLGAPTSAVAAMQHSSVIPVPSTGPHLTLRQKAALRVLQREWRMRKRRSV